MSWKIKRTGRTPPPQSRPAPTPRRTRPRTPSSPLRLSRHIQQTHFGSNPHRHTTIGEKGTVLEHESLPFLDVLLSEHERTQDFRGDQVHSVGRYSIFAAWTELTVGP